MTLSPVLVVDGANVVGSRPDGWWRDRPGASRRLHDQLLTAGLGYDRVVLVLEGQAKAGVPDGAQGAVETVHARADGDATIVELTAGLVAAGRSVAVVTADRGLAGRVAEQGGRTITPSWLLDRLEERP